MNQQFIKRESVFVKCKAKCNCRRGKISVGKCIPHLSVSLSLLKNFMKS